MGHEVRVTGGGRWSQGLVGHSGDLKWFSIGGFKQGRKEI